MEIQDKEILKWPAKLKAGSHRRNKDKYCLFHRDRGHTITECFDLKEAIEALIQRGQLKEYVGEGGDQSGNLNRTTRSRRECTPMPRREIKTIFCGPAGGDSRRKRKNKAREARVSPKVWEVLP